MVSMAVERMKVIDVEVRGYIVPISMLILSIGIIFIASCAQDNQAEEPDVSQSAPGGITNKNLVDGRSISLDDMKGHVLVINYWATWCPSCRSELPGLIELHEKYKGRRFAVIGVSVDKAGESVVKDFIKGYGISYPVIMNTKQLQKKYEEAIDRPIRAIPTSLVVDRSGRIASVHVGFIAMDVLEQEIQSLL